MIYLEWFLFRLRCGMQFQNDDFSGVIYGIVKDHNNYDVMCVFFISVQVTHTIFSYGMSANKGLILRFGGVFNL